MGALVRRNHTEIGSMRQSIGAVGTADITFVLLGKDAAERYEGEAGIIASRLQSGRVECAVSVYKPPAGFSERHFDFLLVHEIFHRCHLATFAVTDREDDDRWVEGSADHFDHSVPDFEDPGWYRIFDARSAATPLTAMQYTNVVFFY